MFLQQETGVDQDSVLAYLSDGRRLRSENVRELAGATDQVRVPVPYPTRHCSRIRPALQTIYVYNKRYLDIDFDRVLQELHVDPPLDPPIDGERTEIDLCIPINTFAKRRSMLPPRSDLPSSRQPTCALRTPIRNM